MAKIFWLTALLLAGAPAAVFAGEAMLGASRDLRRNAATSGGGLSTSASFKLLASAGEVAASSFTGVTRGLHTGYGPLNAQPGTITAITAVSKATGTLELSWTAPGMDGFLGSLTGFYRVDYSSDPAHVFAPTTFQLEFATSVVPGAYQSITLSGLDANTTYYTRVYLADPRKVVAETSSPSSESTLARLPASPVFTGLCGGSASFTWALPADGAEGFDMLASTSDFIGGTVVSSQTRSALTLTISGLTGNTTYFFKLGSLNWQDDVNFTTVYSTFVPISFPDPIANLASAADALQRQVEFTWTLGVTGCGAADGVLVQVSTNPITITPTAGVGYPEGTLFADGSVVESTSAVIDHLAQALVLDTTYFYQFYGKNSGDFYSVAVGTTVLLDLPPLMPAGLQAALNGPGTLITLDWAAVTSSIDGTPWKVPGLPEGLELTRYDIFRSTGLIYANWVWVASAAATATGLTGVVPVVGQTYYYKVLAQDTLGISDRAMVADTDGHIYALSPDQISRLKIPAEIAASLTAAGNGLGAPLLVRASEQPGQIGGKIVKSIDYPVRTSPSGLIAEAFQFPGDGITVNLHYTVQGGQVVGNAVSGSGVMMAAAVEPAINAGEAGQRLGAYWYNGSEWVKVFGQVDTFNQTVSVQSTLAGSYQIRSLFRTAGFSFDVSQVTNKVITPNGDGLNDFVTFLFDNPRDSAFSGKIYDLRGGVVAEMRRGTQIGDTLIWDGKANGRTVPRGVYIYQIKSEDKVFNGTVVVIR